MKKNIIALTSGILTFVFWIGFILLVSIVIGWKTPTENVSPMLNILAISLFIGAFVSEVVFWLFVWDDFIDSIKK